MILNDIKEKLEGIKDRVYYAMVDESVRDTVWDYIVFNRARMSISTNKTSYSDYFDVTIVCENYIPEGIDEEIITKMLEIDGIRLADNEGVYNYVQKQNTNIVVEMLTLHFVKARKKI